jgi:hypothetical protein
VYTCLHSHVHDDESEERGNIIITEHHEAWASVAEIAIYEVQINYKRVNYDDVTYVIRRFFFN